MADSTPVGTEANPLRVAIVGAGPAGFYAADHLLKQTEMAVTVDMFDRLLTPYGLVRHGVAPDHLKIKNVTRSFATTAADPRFRFFGNVEFGTDITIDDLKRHYHQVMFCTGAQTDRQLGIPGEDLVGSHPATAFVAWYNGHPDYCDHHFDLSQESVVIVGVGNVAIDVARILCLSPEELNQTDMPAYAVEALSKSRIRDVYVLGRRGPAQAAFTNPELKELGELQEADLIILPEEAELDELSAAEVEALNDRMLSKKVEMIQEFAARPAEGKKRRLHLRFMVSPTELVDDGTGAIGTAKLVRNRLEKTETGTIACVPKTETEEIAAGMVFRSVGYRGVSLPGIPFNDRWGVIANSSGRVIDAETGEPVAGEYTAGWIKRGPSGVIGTNKPDALESVTALLQDAADGRTWQPLSPASDSVNSLLMSRGVLFTSFDDWCSIDEAELAEGLRCGRPRVKFNSKPDMWSVLNREGGRAAG
ncbi:MAG: FAD-dependent oxidoreductase [Dehalococcoidia bacterium]